MGYMWIHGITVAEMAMKAGAGPWLNDIRYTVLCRLTHRHGASRVAYVVVCNIGHHSMITQLHGLGEIGAL